MSVWTDTIDAFGFGKKRSKTRKKFRGRALSGSAFTADSASVATKSKSGPEKGPKGKK